MDSKPLVGVMDGCSCMFCRCQGVVAKDGAEEAGTGVWLSALSLAAAAAADALSCVAGLYRVKPSRCVVPPAMAVCFARLYLAVNSDLRMIFFFNGAGEANEPNGMEKAEAADACAADGAIGSTLMRLAAGCTVSVPHPPSWSDSVDDEPFWILSVRLRRLDLNAGDGLAEFGSAPLLSSQLNA